MSIRFVKQDVVSSNSRIVYYSGCGYYHITKHIRVHRYEALVRKNGRRVDIGVLSYGSMERAVNACESHEHERFLEVL